LATLGWSLSGLFVRFLPHLDGWQINCWRGFWTGVALLIYILAVYGHGAWQKFADIPIPALVISASFFALGTTLYVASLTRVSTATVSVIGAASPLVAAMFSPWITHELPGIEAWVAAVLAIIGVSIIAWDGIEGGHIVGLVLALSVPFTFAGQTLALRRYRNVDMIPSICIGGFLSFLLAGFLGFAFGDVGGGFNVDPHSMSLLALMALLQLAIPLIFYTYGARSVPAVTLALIAMLDAVLNPLWPWLIVGERPGNAAFIGGSVIICAVLFSIFGRKILGRQLATHAIP
jgi:drug/metabolite transporter (DMT)-like permease